jgi:hypothetical protein
MQIDLDDVKRKTREICRDSSEYSRILGYPAKIQKDLYRSSEALEES